jgi:ATPase related to the helicase subunit of the Holliday junction resolvase
MYPLAERLRPKTLDDYIGQQHLVGKDAVLRRMIESGNISSFILWGPPGVGKTTLARIIANKLDRPFYTLSAVSSGVKDVREVIERAKQSSFLINNVQYYSSTRYTVSQNHNKIRCWELLKKEFLRLSELQPKTLRSK